MSIEKNVMELKFPWPHNHDEPRLKEFLDEVPPSKASLAIFDDEACLQVVIKKVVKHVAQATDEQDALVTHTTTRDVVDAVFKALRCFPAHQCEYPPRDGGTITVCFFALTVSQVARLFAVLADQNTDKRVTCQSICDDDRHSTYDITLKVALKKECSAEDTKGVMFPTLRSIMHAIFDALGIFPEQKTKKEENDE